MIEGASDRPASSWEQGRFVREKGRAALASVLASVLLTALKLAAAVATSSLGLLAEAAHSALDLGAAAVTWVAVRTSWRPPDADHQYGHGKIENLAALAETVLLVLTSVWIVREALARLLGEAPEIHSGWIGVTVIGVSIAVDLARSRDLSRVARLSGSQALEADALHFSSDILSSVVVLLGLTGAWIAHRIGPPWLAKADSVAAIVVAAFVLLLSWKLGRRAIDMLLDRAPAGLRGAIQEALAGIPDLVEGPRVRVRQAGDTLFADIELPLRPGIPVAQADRAAAEARRRVRAITGDRASVLVELRAVPDDAASVRQRILEAVALEGAHAHNITLRQDGDGKQADLHVELPGRMTLAEAHAVADRIEARILAEVGSVRRVDIHLELQDEEPARADPLDADARAAIEQRIGQIAGRLVGPSRVHDLVLRRVSGGLYLSCHCFFPAGTPLSEAHAATDRLEVALRAGIPELARVSVHAEPEDTHE